MESLIHINHLIVETLLTPANNPTKDWVIICHPHPLFGGTMHNKVVTTLAKTYQALNFTSLRFNFRGVGKSTGIHDNGVGETEDLLSLIAWAKAQGAERIHLAGFSFGSYVAAEGAMLAEDIKSLVTVAPMVSRFGEEKINIPCPWILVESEADEIIPYADVQALLKSLNLNPHIIHFDDASHFFHGKLVDLQTRLTVALKEVLRLN